MVGPPTYLLDTNVLILSVRGSTTGRTIVTQFGLTTSRTALISVVTVGEMLAFGRKRKWGVARQSRLNAELQHLPRIDIHHPDILNAYAELDAFAESVGRSMGKNDLWIAATALVSGLTLLTNDADFDFLHPGWIRRIRVDASTGLPIP